MGKSRETPISSADRSRLGALARRYRTLRRKLAHIGYLAQGTIAESSLPCGNPSCRCRRNRRRRHGPYAYWTTKVKGRTVSRLLNPPEARLYKEWIQNRKRLYQTIQTMMEVSRDVAVVLLADPDAFIPGR